MTATTGDTLDTARRRLLLARFVLELQREKLAASVADGRELRLDSVALIAQARQACVTATVRRRGPRG